MKRGSADSLKASVRWDCSAKARQMRLTVLWLRPERQAMDRVLQWVASLGVTSKVNAITGSVCLGCLPCLRLDSPYTRSKRNP